MLNKKTLVLALVAVAALFGGYLLMRGNPEMLPEQAQQSPSASNNSITITEEQARQVHVEPVLLREFIAQRSAVGYVDFNQDTTVPVLSNYAGRIRQVSVRAGDSVKKGQALYTVDSPDLVQAISALIASAGVRSLATRNLERARKMVEIQAASQKDLDQALSDQQSAEGAYQAARDAVRIFGKTDAEMDKIIASRKVSGEMTVLSPINGKVVARNAAPGMLVQAGSTPAPVAVADTTAKWVIANVTEYDAPKLKLGLPAKISITAIPGKTYKAEIVNIGASVDIPTRRVPVRTEVQDPEGELQQQMLATFVFDISPPVMSTSISPNGIVREGDGTMTAFVTTDGRQFTRRALKVGMEQNGFVQILEGLSDGEKVAGDGAIFLSNAILLQAR
ncbi:MAG: efflux RND transporter periplasmic adaptor subunit [Burkholderiales bacterium]